MILESVRRFEPKVAAGLLAQTALRLERTVASDDQKYLVDDQPMVETSIIEELRKLLGIPAGDYSSQAVAALTDALDEQTEIVGQLNKTNNFDRLSTEGLLSSDLYDVVFQPHLPDNFAWRWSVEAKLASSVVKNPDKEEVLRSGLPNAGVLPLVSIFARYFHHKFPARSFWMLVLGERSGRTFSVAQIWRAYPGEVDLSSCETLLDVVHAIATKFGHSIELGGVTGKFFFRANYDEVKKAEGFIKIPLANKRLNRVTVTYFRTIDTDQPYVFLVVSVNLSEYFKAVERWRGWDKNILDELNMEISAHSRAFIQTSASTQPTPDLPDAPAPDR